MPIDKDGNRADIIIDTTPTFSRLNVGALYERYIKASIVKVSKIIKEEFSKFNKESVYDLKSDEALYLYDIVLEYIKLFENEQYNFYLENKNKNNLEAIYEILDETISDVLKVYLNVNNEKRKYEIVKDIKNSKFEPVRDKVKFRYLNKDRVSKEDVFIAPMYIILLSKIADTTLATSSAKLNHFGLPIVVNKSDKFRLPHRNSPVRILGETEGRLITAYGGRELMAELKDMNASIDTHSHIYRNIITVKEPCNTEEFIDRNKYPYGKERGLKILNSLWNSVGKELKYVKDEKIEYDYIESDEDSDVSDIEHIKELLEVNFNELDEGEDEE